MTERASRVILVHGYAASSIVMAPIALTLRRQGFTSSIWSYSTLFQSIAHHSQRLKEYFNSLDERDEDFHVVAHSMGGIVTRAAIAEERPRGLKRIVMLAPPNRGLPFANYIPSCIKHVSQPLGELSTHPSSYVNELKERTDCEIAVISARYDWMIPVKNTRLTHESCQRVVHGTHNSILFTPSVAHLVARFLNSGSLER